MREQNVGEDVVVRSPSDSTKPVAGDNNRAPVVLAGYGWRVGLFYGALFLIYGVQIPFMPVWLDWRGLSAREIAFVGAAPFFLRVIVSPLLAMIADQKGSHRTMILVLATMALMTALGLSQTSNHDVVVLVSIVLAISMISMMPLTETIAVKGVRHGDLDYGRMRLWGSASFILVGFIAGALVTEFQAGVIIWLTALACLATLVFGFILPTARLYTGPNNKLTGLPPDVSGEEKTKQKKSHSPHSLSMGMAAAAQLVRQPIFFMFLIAGGTIQASHATFYTFGALIWRDQGISATWIGGLWAIGVVAEILVFAYARDLFRGWGCSQSEGVMVLLIAGALAAVLRWVLMSFDPSLWFLVVLQMLHGLTYGCAHLGAIHFMSAAIPERTMGTAQALYGSVAAGIAMGLAMLATGPLYEWYGGASYLAMAALSMFGLVFSLVICQRWSGGVLLAENAPNPKA
ncbi:MAG: MFS transporter [Hyphomicrobiaceae bacterium]